MNKRFYICTNKETQIKKLEIMKKSIKLNSSQAMDIISALEVKISNLKSDIDNSFFPICDLDKEELKRMQNLVATIDKTFWTEDGELK